MCLLILPLHSTFHMQPWQWMHYTVVQYASLQLGPLLKSRVHSSAACSPLYTVLMLATLYSPLAHPFAHHCPESPLHWSLVTGHCLLEKM